MFVGFIPRHALWKIWNTLQCIITLQFSTLNAIDSANNQNVIIYAIWLMFMLFLAVSAASCQPMHTFRQ